MGAVRRLFAASLVVAALALTAAGQERAATVAAVEGTAEVLHAGRPAREQLRPGDPVLDGDQQRTLSGSKLQTQATTPGGQTVVQTLGPDTEGTANTAFSFSLIVGRIRVVLSNLYARPRTTVEVDTPTAVGGARGTGFIVQYDPARAESLYLGLYDTTFVRSKADPQGRHEVFLGPGMATEVARGKLPTRPHPLPEEQRRELLAATELLTGGLPPESEIEPLPGIAPPLATSPGFPPATVVNQPPVKPPQGREQLPPPLPKGRR